MFFFKGPQLTKGIILSIDPLEDREHILKNSGTSGS